MWGIIPDKRDKTRWVTLTTQTSTNPVLRYQTLQLQRIVKYHYLFQVYIKEFCLRLHTVCSLVNQSSFKWCQNCDLGPTLFLLIIRIEEWTLQPWGYYEWCATERSYRHKVVQYHHRTPVSWDSSPALPHFPLLQLTWRVGRIRRFKRSKRFPRFTDANTHIGLHLACVLPLQCVWDN